MWLSRTAPLIGVLLYSACAGSVPETRSPVLEPELSAPLQAEGGATERDADGIVADGMVELVESWPAETTLDHPDIRDAADVWLEMIGRAQSSLDIAQFYISNEPNSRLDKVLIAVEEAAARGVAVRVMVDQRFFKTYPDSIERLKKVDGIEARVVDLSNTMGGVLHAKYFVVDDREVFVGSQNFDWRALDHIVELGVRIQSDRIARTLLATFEADWKTAGGNPAPRMLATAPSATEPSATEPSETEPSEGAPIKQGLTFDDDIVETEVLVSPRGHIPQGASFDLPELIALIDGATQTIRVQLLSYRPAFYDGRTFDTIDKALRKAAARGVTVQLLVGDWLDKPEKREPLRALDEVTNIEVRVASIPKHSSGEIPFGRVIHAKLCVVDDARTWIGTSNWSGDYFEHSRNVGFRFKGKPMAAQVADFFDGLWTSAYVLPFPDFDAKTPAKAKP